MSKRVLLFGISMMTAIAICIVVLSMAWFSSSGQERVGTEGLAISAYDPTVLSIGSKIIQNVGQYRGETGLTFYKYVDSTYYEYDYVMDGDDYVTKTFSYYRYTAANWTHQTFYWGGDTSVTKRYRGKVLTVANLEGFAVQSTCDILIVKQREGDYYYALFDSDGNEQYNTESGNFTFMDTTHPTGGATPENATTVRYRQAGSDSSSMTITLATKSVIQDFVLYYNNDSTITKVYATNNPTQLCDSNGNPRYTHSGTNNSVVFNASDRTTKYDHRNSNDSGDCYTVRHLSSTVDEFSNATTKIVRTKVGTNYKYEIYTNKNYSKPKYTSSNSNDVITVEERTQTAYAVYDESTMVDAAYSISKQFDLLLKNGEAGAQYYLQFGADVLGVIPETSTAADLLSIIPGVEISHAYYTFVGTSEGSRVIFGLDSVVTGANTQLERIKVKSYDDLTYTLTTISYVEYQEQGDRYFVTTEGYPFYYLNSQTGDFSLLTSDVVDNVEDVIQGVEGGTLTVAVQYAAQYLPYDHGEEAVTQLGEIMMSPTTTRGINLYHKDDDPVYLVATSTQVVMGEGLYYYDQAEDEYVSLESDSVIVAACQPLYVLVDEQRELADQAQIESGEGLYYYRNGENVLATSEELALRTTLYVMQDAFSVATSSQMNDGVNLYRRESSSVVYNTIDDTVLYSAANEATVVFQQKTMYSLPTSMFYENFSIEVDLFDRTGVSDSDWAAYTEEEKMAYTTKYYADSNGILRDAVENGNAFIPGSGERVIYCKLTVYFLDSRSLHSLYAEDNGVQYIYSYSSQAYVNDGPGEILREFKFSDLDYIGSHFVLRLFAGTLERNN